MRVGTELGRWSVLSEDIYQGNRESIVLESESVLSEGMYQGSKESIELESVLVLSEVIYHGSRERVISWLKERIEATVNTKKGLGGGCKQ